MSGTLYLVPTPIGNLGDISPRMAEALAQADFIAAEDTRVSVKLLNHLGIKKPMVSYYRHNTSTSGPAILERLLAGESCALVTDAGTPAISDPGEELVALCAQAGVEVVSIPGPCALVAALAASGQPTGRFTFEGFLAMNKKNRRRHLESLRGEERTMIFYEAPHKLLATLAGLPVPGADQAPRGDYPHHPGGGGGALSDGAPQGGVCAGGPGSGAPGGAGGHPGGRPGPGPGTPGGGGAVPAGRGEAGRQRAGAVPE